MATIGAISWFELGNEWNRKHLAHDTFYVTTDFVNTHLCIPMIIYQLWNVVICILLNDLRDPIMIAHHLVTAYLAYTATIFGHYYACFFFGLTEITNIPLTIMDIFDHFPYLNTKYSYINNISRISFAIMFYTVRIFMWIQTMYNYWRDSYIVITSGRAHSIPILLLNIISSAFLTVLQLLWAYKIASAVLNGDVAVKEHESSSNSSTSTASNDNISTSKSNTTSSNAKKNSSKNK
jgi:hypothetical protein